jgi:hypothetical protein
MSRAVKNGNYIESIAPDVRSKLGSKGISSIISSQNLRRLQTMSSFQEVVSDKEVVKLLEKNRPPLPKATVSTPLFNGTLHFVQLTFNTPNGSFSVSEADIQTAINYSKLAVVPISAYSSQYGQNSISVSSKLIQFSVTLNGNTFNDSDLQGWVDDIIQTNNLPKNSAIIILNNVQAPTNTDGDINEGVGGYHFHTGKNPYAYCNVFGENLTIDDSQNAYAEVLSHEIAELAVDPLADLSNPEVCDACAGNCSNLWDAFFDDNNQFIDGAQEVPPPFKYAFFINCLIKPKFYNPNTECAFDGSNLHDVCVYAPP